MNSYFKIMAQLAKPLASKAKPDNPSLIPRTHMMEREKQLLTSTCVLGHTSTHTHTHTRMHTQLPTPQLNLHKVIHSALHLIWVISGIKVF